MNGPGIVVCTVRYGKQKPDAFFIYLPRYKPAEVSAEDWDTAIYGALSRARELRRLWQEMQDPALRAFLQQVTNSLEQRPASSCPSSELESLMSLGLSARGLHGLWSAAGRDDAVAPDAIVHILQTMWQR